MQLCLFYIQVQVRSLLLLSLLSLLTGVGLEGTCNSLGRSDLSLAGILRSSLDVCFHIWTMKFIAAPNELLYSALLQVP